VEGGSFFWAGFGKEQGSTQEVEGGQADPGGDFRPGWFSVEAAGDHQVGEEEEVVLEGEDDAFAEAACAEQALTVERLQRWLDRSQEEGADQADSLQWLAEETGLESLDVDREVR
jgi:hypothetical protein